MAMKRICDICGASMMEGTGYQFSVPAVLTDNSGLEYKPIDSSMTDVCPTCTKERSGEIISTLLNKAGA